MELQARRTDQAVKKLGDDLDGGVGSNKQVRQIERAQREMRTLGRDVDRTSGAAGGGRGGFRRLGREAGDAGDRIDRLLRSVLKLRVLMRVGMFAGIATGIGVLVQAVGALAIGLTAMVPQLVGAVGALGSMVGPALSLGGAMAGLPAVLLAVGGATTVVGLAMSDVGEAFQGNEAALKRLDPAARQFLKTLESYRPMLNRLRLTAQGGLFAGLGDALAQLRVAFPYVNALVGDFSRRLGDLARQAAQRFTQRGFLQDFMGIGQQSGRLLTRGGQALMNLASALRHVAVAAQPFTDWMSRVALRWSTLIDAWAMTGRQSGRFERFFTRVQARMQVFFRIIANLWRLTREFFRAASPTGDRLWRAFERATNRWADFVQSITGQGRIRAWFQQAERDFNLIWDIVTQITRGLVGLGRAGRSTGGLLWRDIDRVAKRWADWVNSMRGQIQLTRNFQAVGAAMREITGLAGDLGGAILRMGQEPALAGMVANLRRLVPMLESFLNTVVRQLGPPLVDILVQVGRMLTILVGAGGPLRIFLELVDRVLRMINTLVRAVPGLGVVLAAALSVIAIQRFTAMVLRLTAAFFGLRTAAASAAVATSAATGGGLAAGALGARAGFGTGFRAGRTGARFVAGPAGTTDVLAGGAALGLGARLGARFGVGTRGAAMLARGAMAGRALMGPLGIAAVAAPMLANLLPVPGRAGGRTTKGVLGAAGTGAALGAALGAPLFGIGAVPGALIGGGIGAGLGLAHGAVHPFGWGATPAAARVQGQMTENLARMGGETPTHRQLGRQVVYLSGLQREYANATSAAGQAALAAIQPELDARRSVLATQNAQIRAERQVRREARARGDVTRARQLGRRAAAQYGVDVREVGGTRAFQALTRRALGAMGGMGIEGRRQFAQPLVQWADALRREGKLPKAEYEKLTAGIKKSFDDVNVKVNVVNGKILDSSKRQWGSIRKALVTEATAARVGLSNQFDQIQALALGKLTAMGYTPAQARGIIAAASSGGTGALPPTAAQTGAVKKATAAMQPGAAVAALTGDAGAAGAAVTGRPDVAPGLWDEIAVGSQFGLAVSSTSRPGARVHGTGRRSLHSYYPSRAVDMSSGSSAGQRDPRMAAAFRALIGRPGLTEVILSPLWWHPGAGVQTISNPTTMADHWNHVHFGASGGGVASALGAAGATMTEQGMASISLRAGHVGGAGPAALMGDAGANAYAAALSRRLDEVRWGGWQADGGSFVARRPTIIGVGEAGAERVTVTPAGGGGGHAVVFRPQINIARVDYRGGGDLERVVYEETARAFERFAAELDGAGVVPE